MKIGVLFTTVWLALQLFISSAGLLIHEHHCKKDGTSYSLFLQKEHLCAPDGEPAECQVNSKCCAASPKKENNLIHVEETPCCVSNLNFIQLDTDYVVSTNTVEFAAFFPAVPCETDLKFSSELPIHSTNYRGPPPLSTLQKLAQLQVYLL